MASISSRMKRGREVDPGDHHAGHLALLDLVVDAREGERELVVRVRHVGEVRVVARHRVGVGVDVEVAFAVLGHARSIAAAMRISVIAVGRLRPPFQDDVEHYRKMLAGLRARRPDRGARGRARAAADPGPRAHLVLLASEAREFDSVELQRVAGAAPPGRAATSASSSAGRAGSSWRRRTRGSRSGR